MNASRTLPKLPPYRGRCNARRKRRRGYCPASGWHTNGRCKQHGGPTPKFVAKMMKEQRADYLPAELSARFSNLNNDMIVALAESLKIEQAMETELLEQLKTGESGAAWDELAESAIAFHEATSDEARLAIASDAFKTVQKGGSSYFKQKEIRTQIQKMHENQRKMTETLSKVQKEVQSTYTEEEHRAFVMQILVVLKNHIPVEQLAAVMADFQRMQAQALPAKRVEVTV